MRATDATMRAVGEVVSSGASKALWQSLRNVTRDEQRGERGRLRCRAASQADFAAVAELRNEVPAAYLLADESRLERMHAIGLYLRSGEMEETATRAGVPLRTLQRWIHEGPSSFLGFAAIYLSAKVKRARAILVRETREFEERLRIARQQCAQNCNWEGRLGCRYESDGMGCASCPIRAIV